MKFKDYVKILNATLEKYPETANYRVYYAIDDEGNDYKPVLYTPTIGIEDMGRYNPLAVVIN